MADHSYVILVYKQSEFLEACLESLIHQSEPSPIILSTSTPSEWLDKIARRYHVPIRVRTGKSAIADDWNFALKQADTPYVTLAHQDDVYQPGFGAAIKHDLYRYPDTLIHFTNYAEWIDGKVRTNNANLIIKRILLFPYYIKRSIRSKRMRKLCLSVGNPVSCPTVTYHRDRLQDFQFNQDYTINLDWDAWIRLAEKEGRFIYHKPVLVWHRLYRASETSSGLQENRRQEDDRRIFQRLWPKSIASLLIYFYRLSYRSNEK
ncbi:MAG: glycosyltransferase [Clostridiaceae bacterium]|nr:glycosyltransferase [Clostridiaceae bacterium]